MGIMENQNSTQGFASFAVSRWELTPKLSAYENNVIIILGVLTFALQLCLALLIMRRCMNTDKKVRVARHILVEHDTESSSQKQDLFRQTPKRWSEDYLSSVTGEECHMSAMAKNYHLGPSIYWDLVQY
ncbi:uncharacterized protein LOC144181505 [Stigmatopora nigra]